MWLCSKLKYQPPKPEVTFLRDHNPHIQRLASPGTYNNKLCLNFWNRTLWTCVYMSLKFQLSNLGSSRERVLSFLIGKNAIKLYNHGYFFWLRVLLVRSKVLRPWVLKFVLRTKSPHHGFKHARWGSWSTWEPSRSATSQLTAIALAHILHAFHAHQS